MNRCRLFKVIKNFILAFVVCLPGVVQAEAISFYIVPADTNEGITADHPNNEAYRSQRSIAGHVLAFPSYLFHWVTRPIGWGVKVAEVKLPKLLQGERGPYGVFPLFELGGEALGSYGLLLYHNELTRYNHKARIEALLGTENYKDFDFEYTIPTFTHERDRLEFDASYSNDPVKSFYGDNSSSLSEENAYATENLEFILSYGLNLSENTRLRLFSGYQKIDIKESTAGSTEDIPNVPEPLLGTTALSTLGSSIRFDFARGTPRIQSGSRYIATARWSRSLTDEEFRYLLYSLEWQQFIPLKFLTEERRFAFKGRIEKAAPIGDKSIPFYKKPNLGSSHDLRGFPSDRFLDDGSLLLTLEYRYPLWNFADVTLFVDEGQVFNRFSEIAISEFHTSYGFGFHLISRKGFAFRTEFAFSKESSRIILSINPNF